MKAMNDRKLDASRGMPKSSDFPENPEVKQYGRPSKVNSFDYPDNQSDILKDQNEMAKDANRGKAKSGYRH